MRIGSVEPRMVGVPLHSALRFIALVWSIVVALTGS